MKKEKISYSMLLEPKLYNRLNKESKKLDIPKVRIISLALDQLFKSKSLGVTLERS